MGFLDHICHRLGYARHCTLDENQWRSPRRNISYSYQNSRILADADGAVKFNSETKAGYYKELKGVLAQFLKRHLAPGIWLCAQFEAFSPLRSLP